MPSQRATVGTGKATWQFSGAGTRSTRRQGKAADAGRTGRPLRGSRSYIRRGSGASPRRRRRQHSADLQRAGPWSCGCTFWAGSWRLRCTLWGSGRALRGLSCWRLRWSSKVFLMATLPAAMMARLPDSDWATLDVWQSKAWVKAAWPVL